MLELFMNPDASTTMTMSEVLSMKSDRVDCMLATYCSERAFANNSTYPLGSFDAT